MFFPRLLSNFFGNLLFLLQISNEFNYDNPNEWPEQFPQCGGFQQSPISISTRKTQQIKLPPLYYGHYDSAFREMLEIRNTGLTVEFEIPETEEGSKPFLAGGPLSDIYIAEAAHFHWGSPQNKGSEHHLNGRQFDLEMHIVHHNIQYENIEIAREYEDGLAVLAILFKVVKTDQVYFPGLNDIYSTLEHIRNVNATISIETFLTLGSIMGNAYRSDYFNYRGSLTTPPCTESVNWIILSTVIPISHVELAKFWELYDARGQKLLNNFRPLQPINYRTIYHQMDLQKYF